MGSTGALEDWFDEQRRRTASHYLAEPDNDFRGSGRSSGAARWEETRRPIADAVHRSGSFLDLGCANGLLLETVRDWVAERGLELDLHGVDFVPGLVDWARRRLPGATLDVANAWTWSPPEGRRYEFIRSSVEMVPAPERPAFLQRQAGWLTDGGRLIICYYRDRDAPDVDLVALTESSGLQVGEVLSTDPRILWAQP